MTDSTRQDEPRPNRGSRHRIPIWVRVSGIVTLVLVAIVASTMLFAGTGIGDGGSGAGHGSGGAHGSRGGAEMSDHNGSGGEHRSGDATQPSDHGGPGGDHGTRDE